jgi:CubicO group peptidase (beta-lactamase class C family)
MKRVIVFILLCCVACQPQNDSGSDFDDLDDFFSEQFPPDEPGGAILIMKGDNIVFSRGYGLANVEKGEEVSPETLFNLGSISKTFVSNAILLLQEEGKLSVEDSIIKYFPDFKNKDIASRVKIRHLLTHTSGLPDIRQVKKDSVFYLTAMDAENWYPITQTDSLEFEPGSNYEYSNPAFNALALIIEQVSKVKWQQYIDGEIFRISGMNLSTITDGPHPENGVSHGYIKVNGEWREKDYGEEPTFAAAGNGGVWSSVTELAQYEMALRQATFLPKEVIERSRTVTPFDNWNGESDPFIGWSWFIDTTNDGLKTVGHTGSQGGFLCNYVTIPDKDLFFTILCNSPRDVTGFTRQIMASLKEKNWLDSNPGE